MQKPFALVVASVVMIAAMFWLVPELTKRLGPAHGYLAVFRIYWFAFCLPMGLIFQSRRSLRTRFGLAVGQYHWVPWLAVGLVVLIGVVSIAKLPPGVTAVVVGIAFAAAAINGVLEEFFWRGAWLEQSVGRWPFQALGWVLFVAWHVPLTFAHGVLLEGGPLAMVAGAAFLGAVWAVIAWRTKRIGWAMISHMGVNAFTFIGLVATNFM